MILPDVNVLLNAYRPEAPVHGICRKWLNSVIDGKSAFGIAPPVLGGVVRISTNRRIYDPPSTMADVLGFCEDLIAQPHSVMVQPGERHWSIFAGLCREPGIRAGLVTDAWFAALAIEHGCEWITLDRDFARFPGLRWSLPK